MRPLYSPRFLIAQQSETRNSAFVVQTLQAANDKLEKAVGL
jgi:hypothetical protein